MGAPRDAGGGGRGSFGGDALAFGMMNSLRTGNAAVDMLVVVMVPIVMAMSHSIVDNIRPAMRHALEALRRNCLRRREYFRTIRHETRITAWGRSEKANGEHNHILQKALVMYLSQKLPSMLRKSRDAIFLLTCTGKEKSTGHYWNKQFGTTAEQLEQYSVTLSIPETNGCSATWDRDSARR